MLLVLSLAACRALYGDCVDGDLDGHYECSGLLSRGTDCDDSDPSVNPDATDTCDNLDNDCDGWVDEGETVTSWADPDGDTYGSGWAEVHCWEDNAWRENAWRDGDCNESDPTINPAATEVCDGADNDCDGEVDENMTVRGWPDTDNDGYGDGSVEVFCGEVREGLSELKGDCNDGDPFVHPSSPELCSNGTDDDCDGLVDCEDGECTLSCTELDCSDGLDEDMDGKVDCNDDDCLEVCSGGMDIVITGGAYQRAGVLSRRGDLRVVDLEFQSVTGRLRWESGSCDWRLTSVVLSDDQFVRGAMDDRDCPEIVDHMLPEIANLGRWGVGVTPGTSSWYITKSQPECTGTWQAQDCADEGPVLGGIRVPATD